MSSRYQTLTYTTASIAAGASSSASDTNQTGLPSLMNIHKVKVTPNTAGGTFDVKIFKADTLAAAKRLAFWDNVSGTTNLYDPIDDSTGTPAEALEGAAIPYDDDDDTGELHLQITNNDGSAHTYDVVVTYEEVPKFLGAGASQLRSTAPRYLWYEDGVGADLKAWDAIADASVLSFRTRTDADGVGQTWLRATRGATTAVSTIELLTAATVALTIDTSQNTTLAGNLAFGTAPTINSTTSRLEQLGGITVGTWVAGGLDLVRTSGDLSLTAITTTSGNAILNFKGFSTGTNPLLNFAGAASVNLTALGATDNNFSRVIGKNANENDVAGIVFINESHTNNTGSIAFLTHPSGGALTRVINIDAALGSILSQTDNSPDLGATATRFRTGYFGTALNVGLATNAIGEIYAGSNTFAALYLDNASADAVGSVLVFRKSRGTQAARTIVVDGDTLGQISFLGLEDATDGRHAAIIYGKVDGTPGAATDMPGRLEFHTTPNGSTTPVLALTINNQGNVGIGTSATFGTSAASVLGILNGTEPSTSPADMVQLYSVDLSAGNATLGLRTETAVAVDALLASTHTLSIRVNGTTYKVLLST